MHDPFVVLMVEDDHSTLSLLAAIARREGFDAVLAQDGNQAMSILKRDSAGIDAMVLDLLLPGTNGFDILLHCWKEILSPQSRAYSQHAAAMFCGMTDQYWPRDRTP